MILVSKKGRIVWQYGQAGVTGSGANELNSPVSARFLPHHRYLITDQGNQRVIELTHKSQIAWQYGTTAVSGSASNQLTNPNSAERRGNNNTVIADQGAHRCHFTQWPGLRLPFEWRPHADCRLTQRPGRRRRYEWFKRF